MIFQLKSRVGVEWRVPLKVLFHIVSFLAGGALKNSIIMDAPSQVLIAWDY